MGLLWVYDGLFFFGIDSELDILLGIGDLKEISIC